MERGFEIVPDGTMPYYKIKSGVGGLPSALQGAFTSFHEAQVKINAFQAGVREKAAKQRTRKA